VAVHNYTFMVQPSRPKEHLASAWKSRTINVLFDCDVNDDSGEAETPAPPPSPEFSRYSGSPYPTSCHTRQQLRSSLRGIAEEEGCACEVKMQSTPIHPAVFPSYLVAEQFREWKNEHTLSYSSVGSNESLSILSKLDDSLVEETERLSLVPVVASRGTVETSATDNAFGSETQQLSDEAKVRRDMLIKDMEQHELRSNKKQCAPEVCRKLLPSEASSDDVIILNGSEFDFTFDEDNPDSPEVKVLNDDNLEVISSECESSGENFQHLTSDTHVSADKSESYCFSSLISEKVFATPVLKTDEDEDSMLSKSSFHGDSEHQYDKQKIDQAPTTVGSQTSETGTTHNHELDDESFSAPARPPSPEFDIEIPEQRVSLPCNSSYKYTGAEYSLISEADDCSGASFSDKYKEELNRNCDDVGDVMVRADEDGGFLSVLSEAALYHATLNHTSDTGNNARTTAITDMCSQDVEEKHCASASASAAIQCMHEGYDTVQKQGPLCEAVQEGEAQEVSPGLDVRNRSVHDDSVNLVSVQQCCAGSHVGSCRREMDATSDLNDSDRRNIEDMNLKSCSEEECFNDTLEEMEMLLKFGMDYMMSSNDSECRDTTSKQSVRHSVSMPKMPSSEMSGFEDFGDSVSFSSGFETCNEDYTEAGTKPEACALNVLNENFLPSSQVVACGDVETISASEVGGILFPKLQTTPLGKFHSKLQAVVSPTVTMKSSKPSPFKVPVNPVIRGTHIPKLITLRSGKKSPLKPVTLVSPCKRQLNYKKILSPVGVYIRNTPSPSLVTNVRPKVCRVATPKRALVGKGASVMSTHDSVPGIEKVHLEVSINLLLLTN
jgi:hypothetical protein